MTGYWQSISEVMQAIARIERTRPPGEPFIPTRYPWAE